MKRLILVMLAVALLAPVVAQARGGSNCCRTSTAKDGHSYRHPITERAR